MKAPNTNAMRRLVEITDALDEASVVKCAFENDQPTINVRNPENGSTWCFVHYDTKSVGWDDGGWGNPECGDLKALYVTTSPEAWTKHPNPIDPATATNEDVVRRVMRFVDS